MVRKGDSAALREWFATAPAIRGGVVANDQLRQRKNLFIVTVTLASRAAIQGGMQVDDALYAQRFLYSAMRAAAVARADYKPAIPHAARLHGASGTLASRQRAKQACAGCGKLCSTPHFRCDQRRRYRLCALCQPLYVYLFACALYVSRPYLSKKFKEEIGESLTDFILKEKTEEAKRLLRYSDKTLTTIGAYLGFSSPSHFSGCLRNTRAMAPESIGKNTVDPKIANLPFPGGIVGTTWRTQTKITIHPIASHRRK